MTESAISDIVNLYTREAGVRSLERQLATICRKIARRKAERRPIPKTVQRTNLHKFLGPPQYLRRMVDREPEVGVVTGLAWTSTGGEILEIEVRMFPGSGKLLITEVSTGPNIYSQVPFTGMEQLAAEFIEVHNPNSFAVDMSDYYLTDATYSGTPSTYYYNLPTGQDAGGGGFGDFFARFPDGATIGAGEVQTISLPGSEDFFTEYGVNPTYELFEDGVAADAVPDMREALTGSINTQGSPR